MPPGRGFSSGTPRIRPKKRIPRPLYILAAVPVLALLAWFGAVWVSGANDGT